jgi:cellulose synthase/poly-beta-1,6-N-acetylglucosamine synthase-like glycosyltransferase
VLTGAIELFLISLGLTYFMATTGAGLRVRLAAARPARTGRRPGRQQGRHGRPRGRRAAIAPAGPTGPRPAAGTAGLLVYYLVPCLDEAAVIADTVSALLADPRARVVVIDDASQDGTGALAAAVSPGRVSVVRRELPGAQQGKGPALNAGYRFAVQDAARRGIDPARLVIGVMDADGRLSPGALDAVLPLFGDPRVGGVQLPVRIRNRGSLLTAMQDIEFWGVCALAQLGRNFSGTASLGGNGQFTRLEALHGLGHRPWGTDLTEDLELTLALASEGWRLVSTPDAWVSQQGVTTLAALLRQRARWYQGHMQAARWLPRLWRARRLSHLGMLELTLYLAVPWTLVLPWSVLFNYNLVRMVGWIAGWERRPVLGTGLLQQVSTTAFWYALSCVPIWLAGLYYWRQQREKGLLRSFLLGHLLLVGNYCTFAACWRALFQLLAGANGWQKTARLTEHAAPAGGTGPAGTHRMDAPWLTLAATGAHRGGANEAQPARARLAPQAGRFPRSAMVTVC